MRTNIKNHGFGFHGKRLLATLSIALLSCFAATSLAQADEIQYCGIANTLELSPPGTISGNISLRIQNANVVRDGVVINTSPLLVIFLSGDSSVYYKSANISVKDANVSGKPMKYDFRKIDRNYKYLGYIITHDTDSLNLIPGDYFSGFTLFNVFMFPAPILDTAVLAIHGDVSGHAGTFGEVKFNYRDFETFYTMQSCSSPGGGGGTPVGGGEGGGTPVGGDTGGAVDQPIASTGILPH